jgi:hypothetical protein
MHTHNFTARAVTTALPCTVPGKALTMSDCRHSNTGSQSDEVLAYQRHSLRLFNDAVPKSQILTAKADGRSDEKHKEGLTSWSRGNASASLGRCPARTSAQHLLHGQAVWSVTLGKGRNYAFKLHHYYSVPSADYFVIYRSPCRHSTHTSCWQRRQNNNPLYNTYPATTTSPKSKVRKRDVRNANNMQPISVRLMRLLNCQCSAATQTQTQLVPTAQRSGSGVIRRQCNQERHRFAS